MTLTGLKGFLVKLFVNLAVILANLKLGNFGREYMTSIPIIKSGVGGGGILLPVPFGWIDRLNDQPDKPMLNKVLEYL